ncbi:hypothetical protein CB0940_09263 [Cercospora beticola]|uniref:Protein GLC8 n=1 Tax=Cercospora beticola TaxID=122368 RepID=A0A2G5HHX4_CERBT|nr:hypothetical protein CB0940_09263 [Cercospora beticola]PIA92151.1 hypothetical protein CB0940_09263 [Cercospora beticola]WPB06432.1 hypothetical protein RHO25_011089 [Cercospora beticola]CAK1366330.1 unnamed protein product [Cercospora beticola]
MAQAVASPQSPGSLPKRPKGILKNSSSYQYTSPDARTSPTSEHRPSFSNNDGAADGSRPAMPARELSEKEIVQMNTEANAGGHRRSSSSGQRAGLARRQSSQTDATTNGHSHQDSDQQRLKWDEANLYLNEGQMGGKMKIDEPKTPYAGRYDPTEDEDEIETINAEELAVDELDMKPRARKASGSRAKERDIPDIDLGEPEMDPASRRESDSERRVHVDQDKVDNDEGNHGEQNEADMTHEEREKHQKFEQMRKKHYEMKNIKNLLGHPEELDRLDDE